MTEAVTRSNKIINRFLSRVTGNDSIQSGIIGIGEEYRFDVGIIHTHMFHAVFFLIATGKLMLLNDAIHIIGHVCAHHQTILRLAVHGLGIYVVIFLIVLYQPAFVLKHSEVVGGFPVNTFIMLIRALRKIYLGLNDMIQGFFVSCRFFTGFGGVQYIVRTGCNLLYQVLGRANAFKRFNCSHGYQIINLFTYLHGTSRNRLSGILQSAWQRQYRH